MIGFLGEGLILLAGIICLGHFFLPQKQEKRSSFISFITHQKSISFTIFLCLFLAFCLFVYAHVTDHFELLNVFLHSHTQKPLLYKVAGTWGSHEGSMLLWCLLLAFYHTLIAWLPFDKTVKKVHTTLFIALQLSFLLFLYVASNPFERLMTMPLEGQDLNPVLQDISLAIHPPHLYLGTLGFALPFVHSLTLLMAKSTDRHHFKDLHTMTLVAFSFLSLGILLGSVWAYYELGWGGWWFFDPVENLALIPWLLGLMGIHVTLISQKKGTHQKASLLISIFTFLSCLLSLALIRSGLLNSVHAFGVDEKRGILLFLLFLFWSFFSFYIYQQKGRSFSSSIFVAADRTSFLTIALLFMGLSCLSVFVGTLFPLLTDALGEHFILSNDFYYQTFLPLWMPLLLLLPLSLKSTWRDDLQRFKKTLFMVFLVMGLLFLAFYIFLKIKLSLLLWLTCATTCFVFLVITFLKKMPLKDAANHLAHTGFALSVIGIFFSSLLSREETHIMPMGTSLVLPNARVTLTNIKEHNGKNYKAYQGLFDIETSWAKTSTKAEERFYWTQGTRHLESALVNVKGFSQLLIMFARSYEKEDAQKVGEGESVFDKAQNDHDEKQAHRMALKSENISKSRDAFHETDRAEVYMVKIISKPYINVMWLGFSFIIIGLFMTSIFRIMQRLERV